MTSLTWTLSASFAGGVLSVLIAAIVSFSARPSWVATLVSYAVGALLGAVFLEILPHALETAPHVETLTATILAGIFLFFILEKLVLWRHCHGAECEAHPAEHVSDDHGRSGMMIMLGDTFHNFVDGILIAGAFIADVGLGVSTSFAIIAHEIPQEIGDFVILLHSGYSKRAALLLNALSGVATVVGALLAYYALQGLQDWVPYLLGLACASMIYVAVADLIPGLHKRADPAAAVQQSVLIALGVASIWVVHVFFSHG